MTIGRRTSLLLGATLGLWVALASTATMGSIVFDQPTADELNSPLWGGDDADGMTPDAPNPVAPSPDDDDPLYLGQLDAQLAPGGAAGNPSTGTQGSSGPTTVALAASPYDLPTPNLQTALPRETSPVLPTGPPFELLRPPRR